MSQALSDSSRSPLAQVNTGPRGHSLLPGGIGKTMLAVGPWSPTAVRGEGWRLWDDTGRELIDLHGTFTVNVHGNAHPAVVSAAQEAAAAGMAFGLPNRHEIEHARHLVNRLTGLDQVRYTNSGTEAVQLAVRLARAQTGRSRVIVVNGSYHGWGESLLPTMGPRVARGIPSGMWDQTEVVGFNDVAALEEVVNSGPGQFAAIVLDLLPNRIGMVPPSDAFLETATRLARHHGIALVVDEVISFRLGYGGLVGARALDADLVCLGKLIGGGLPIGALVGKAHWMTGLDTLSGQSLEHGGTFAANPVSMAAGVAALDLLDEPALAHIDALGQRFRDQLVEPLARHGWQPRGQGSLCRIFPAHARDNGAILEAQLRLWWALYERGVLIARHGVVAISTVMNSDVIDRAASAVVDAMDQLS